MLFLFRTNYEHHSALNNPTDSISDKFNKHTIIHQFRQPLFIFPNLTYELGVTPVSAQGHIVRPDS